VRIELNRAVLARFHRMLSKPNTGCWIATTSNTADGYARWRYKPGAPEMYVHKWAYLAFIGDVPKGMQVDHKCHTEAVERGECDGGDDCPHRRCCNPEHLELVTGSENTLRQNHANRRKDTCPKGHPLSGTNLVIWNDGKRRCRECLRSR
jgi:HNH endonuclease